MTENAPQTTLSPEQLSQLKAQLRDIHLPPSVDWWPPAPGWWLLGLMLTVLLFFCVKKLLKLWRRHQLKSYLLAELALIKRQHEQNGPSTHSINACIILLKRICLSYANQIQGLSNQNIAPMTGAELAQLIAKQTQSHPLSTSSLTLLEQTRFQANAPEAKPIETLLTETELWVNALTRRLS